MVVKFNDNSNDMILEVEKLENSVSFFVYQHGEEQVGQFIELPLSEVQNLLKHLQSTQLYQ